MKAKIGAVLSLCLLLMPLSSSTQTLGLITHTPASQNGHTLFAPSVSRSTYLIDNCGYALNEWTSSFSPGLSAYLLEDGNLLRTARIASSFNGGGSGGRIERYTWDDQLIWAYDFSAPNYHQHHDIEYMPNGNILIIAWESKNTSDVIAAGRQSVGNRDLWSTYIAEITPIGSSQANIVWEWRAWDHLIQNVDSTLANFGSITAHPERIDINLDPSANSDWLHVNGIDYNAELDQIMLSVHDVNEVWIIDHSTTTSEAQGSVGGQSGKGGDLIYRWGNPQNYGLGSEIDQKLFGQHDARWIESGMPGAGAVMVFNNQHVSLAGEAFSTVDVWLPDLDTSGHYLVDSIGRFEPQNTLWSVGQGDVQFHSSRISGAHRLQNGNTLICVGRSGEFIEVDSVGDLVWKYINPVAQAPLIQGSPPVANFVFRATKYPIDYAGFDGKDLTPGGPIELDPLTYDCDPSVNVESVENYQAMLEVFPNPATDVLHIKSFSAELSRYEIRSSTGQIMSSGEFVPVVPLDITDFSSGLYIITLRADKIQSNISARFLVL